MGWEGELGEAVGGIVPEVGETSSGAIGGGDDPKRASADGKNGREGFEHGFGNEGGFIDDDHPGLGVAAGRFLDGGTGDEPGAVGQEQRLRVDSVRAEPKAEFGGEMGNFEEEFTSLGGYFGGHHDERAGMAQGEMERSQGGDGAFSSLA